MAGHSKWANIKHRKGRQDAARGKLFAKLGKVIEAAARAGGGDLEANATLATAVAKAKSASMPNDNIDRAIKRGTGEAAGGAEYVEMWYEGYGPGGVALYIQVLTDNRNRAASEVRSVFTRYGGNLGEPGSVGYLFSQKGVLMVQGEEEQVLLAALEAGAEDVQESGDRWEVVAPPTQLEELRQAISTAGGVVDTADVTQLPASTVSVNQQTAPKLLKLVDQLEELDDVQGVFANFEIDDSVLAAIAEE